jgi:high affinity Mn2+ porin
MRAFAAASAVAMAASSALAEEDSPLYFQATVAEQAHPSFHALYSGTNSLRSEAESALSVVMDLGARIHPWRGAEIVVQPELAGGRGLSSTLGVAAYPSGEVYRIGNPEPALILAKLSLRQTAGPVTVTLGKLSTPDLFDNDPVANDPHTRFMSWGLWASAAYDYPADVRGATWGIALDYTHLWWSARAGMFLEPQVANGAALERDFTKARGLVGELEARSQRGAVRVLAFLNTAHMGSYAKAIARHVDVSETRADGRTKGGVAASANYDFGSGRAAFARASFDDGQNETWAFTEIDRSLAFGAVQTGGPWGRERDEIGAAVVVSALSAAHRAYLASGGYGFLIGDGALRYGVEVLAELFYRAALSEHVSLGVNYQPVFNPAFNRDRGPVHIFTARAHVAFEGPLR